MNKTEFITALGDRLAGLPREDSERCIEYYSEMIDDRIEDGMSEDEAVADVGSIDDAVRSSINETSLPRIVKEKLRPKRRLKAWEIVLLIVGAPVWVPVTLALMAVILAVYIVIWAVALVFYCVDLCLLLCGIAVAGFSGYMFMQGQPAAGLFMIGCGLVLMGLSIPVFFGCNLFAKACVKLGRAIIMGIKFIFVGKGRAA